MFHFFKKKPLVIDCFVSSSDSYAAALAPIRRSSHFIPEWFKKLPKSNTVFNSIDSDQYYRRSLTARGCVGITNQLTAGFIIPMWSDVNITTRGADWRYQFSDCRSTIMHHGSEQAKGFMNGTMFLKLESPWIFKSSRPIKYIVQPCFYHLDTQPEYTVVPGINEPTSMHNVVNTNIFINIKVSDDERHYFIKHNTPMVQYIPLTDQSLKINVEVIDEQLFTKFNSNKVYQTFNNKGLSGKKIIRSCPFSSR